MDQVVAFGKKYGKWIAAGLATVAVGVVAYKFYNSDDEDYIEVDVELEGLGDSDEPTQTEED